MLFDNDAENAVNRIRTFNPINDNISYYPDKIIIDQEKIDRAFFDESKEIVLKEAYSKIYPTYRHIFMNEAVEDFITKLSSIMNDVVNDLDMSFNKLAKTMTKKFMSNKKYLDKYKDEFLGSNVVIKVQMYKYTIDNGVPSYITLENNNGKTSVFSINMSKIDPKNLKSYRKDDKYFSIIRGEILGYKNKSIKEDNYSSECWKVYRNGTDKQEIFEIDAPFKAKILADLLSCEAQLRMIENDKETIKDFIRHNLKSLVNDYEFIKKHNEFSDFEFDSYSSFVYNKINEMRLLLKYYNTAFAYKMDAVQCKNNDYMTIFREVVSRTGISEGMDNTYEFFNGESYIIHSEGLDHYLQDYTLNAFSEEILNGFMNEEVQLFSEDVFESLSKAVSTLLDMFTNFNHKFINKTVKSFNAAFPKMSEFNKLDLNGFKRSVYTYDVNRMKAVMDKVQQYANIGKTDKNLIQEYAQNPNEWLRKNIASALQGNYNPKGGIVWADFVKAQLRGPEITNTKQAIARAFAYCEDNTYNSNKNSITKVEGLESLIKALDADIKKAKVEKNNNASLQNNSVDLLVEDEGMDKINAENQKNDVSNKANAEKLAPDGEDIKGGGTGSTNELQNKKKFFTELQHIQAWTWGIFEEGRSQLITYLNKIKEFQKIRNAKGKIVDTVNDIRGKKSESYEFFTEDYAFFTDFELPELKEND